MSSLISGLLGVISNRQTNQVNQIENQKNRQFQHAEASLSYQRQRQLIQEQNQYNSFGNQKKLMKEAGYNPYNLVSGAAGTAVSSSSTSAPQAGSTSAIPNQQLDAGTLGALSDVALKDAQIRNINADTNKKNEEINLVQNQAAYQKTQTDFQEEFNRIYKTYGEYEKILGCDRQEFETNYIKSQRDFTEVQTKLARYDLNDVKPAELANLTADTLKKGSEKFLADMQAAKTDEERKFIAKNFALQCALVRAQVLQYTANARYLNTQSDLWSPGGVLHTGATLSNNSTILLNNKNALDWNLTKKYINDYDKNFQLTLLNSNHILQGQIERNSQRDPYYNGHWSVFWNIFDEVKDVIPFRSAK